MQRNTIFFIVVKVLHVSGGFAAHHQELKNCTYSIWYVPGLLAATAMVQLAYIRSVASFYVHRVTVTGHIALCGILPINEKNYCSELNSNGSDQTA
jgi:hypothetical protein